MAKIDPEDIRFNEACRKRPIDFESIKELNMSVLLNAMLDLGDTETRKGKRRTYYPNVEASISLFGELGSWREHLENLCSPFEFSGEDFAKQVEPYVARAKAALELPDPLSHLADLRAEIKTKIRLPKED